MNALPKEWELHQLIVAQDQLALSKLYETCAEEIISYLKQKYFEVYQKDKDVVLEAINEAFLNYFFNPSSYNPEKKTLKRFLIMAAEGDLINRLQKDKKYANIFKSIPMDVELEENFWNSKVRAIEDPENNLITTERFAAIEQLLLDHFGKKEDVEVAKMILTGERETERFAAVLKLEHLSNEQIREEVKRVKDRIKKYIKRNDLEQKIKQVYER